jgi:hypothetical protein
MCDYSLHGIKNRLAEEGEALVVHRFYTGSKGLTSPEYLKPIEKPSGFMAILRKLFLPQSNECAVCIPDGARLMLCGISPALQQAHGLEATETASSRQVSAEAATYRDALEFKNSVKLLLQELPEGQNVQVMALSSDEVRTRDRSPFRSLRNLAREANFGR